MPDFFTQERAFVATTVFRVAAGQPATTLASQLPRRERWVLDIASTLASFLHVGYIEPVSVEQFSTTKEERYAGSV